MKRRPPNSSRSSAGCAPVELLIPTAPRFAALLALQAAGLPLLLIVAPIAHGALAALACAGLALLAAPAAIRLCLLRGPDAPRRLRFTPEGALWLDRSGGRTEPVTVGGRSLVAGPWWLLVLQGERGHHAVLLEAGRVDPAVRAALGRCLRRLGPAPPAAGLR